MVLCVNALSAKDGGPLLGDLRFIVTLYRKSNYGRWMSKKYNVCRIISLLYNIFARLWVQISVSFNRSMYTAES